MHVCEFHRSLGLGILEVSVNPPVKHGMVRPNLKKHTVFQLSNFDPIRISSPGVTCVSCGQRRMPRNFCPRLSWLVFDAVVASLVVAVLATLSGKSMDGGH